MKTALIGFLVLFTHGAFAMYGTVFEKVGNILILTTQDSHKPYIAVTNYSGTDATFGKRLSFQAKKVGVYDWGSSPVELWDAGAPMPANATTSAIESARLETEIKALNAQIAALEAQRAVKIQRYNALKSTSK